MPSFLAGPGSYFGAIIFMILTGFGLPLPEEVAIVAVGVAAREGTMDPWLGLMALLVGGLAGDCCMYWVGRHFGRRIFDHPRLSHHLTPEREAQIEVKLKQHGLKVLFLSRFMVGVRSPVYLSAGVLKFNFKRFFLYDLICATVVITTFFTISYFLGGAVYDMIRKAELAMTAIVVIAVVTIGIICWVRHRRKVQEAEVEKSMLQEDDPANAENGSDDVDDDRTDCNDGEEDEQAEDA